MSAEIEILNDRQDGNDKIVALKFSATKNTFVPKAILTDELEGWSEAEQRAGRKGSGQRLIDRHQKVGMIDLLDQLEDAGWKLVVGFHEKRFNPDTGLPFNMARFEFVRGEDVDKDKDMSMEREALREILKSAAWAVDAFRNPYFEGDEAVEGETTLELTYKGRHPLLRPDGSPIAVWERDEKGEKVGDAPVPLTPEHVMNLKDGIITIEPV